MNYITFLLLNLLLLAVIAGGLEVWGRKYEN